MSEDIVTWLREAAMSARTTERVICDKAADEIERLMCNAKSDAQLLATYHKWCEINGCAPSLRDLSTARAALGEEKKG